MPETANPPAIVAVDMGYGHLRAGEPLAARFGAPLLDLDRPPLADDHERRLWARVRWFHETASRLSQLPVAGTPFRTMMDAVTHIPSLYPLRDLSEPNAGTKYLERMALRGLGKGLVEYLAERQAPLVTTFYAPAVLADHLGSKDVFCVVTDTDINRVWAPIDPKKSRATYLAPCRRVVKRLEAYGVAPERIVLTGFPLPDELLGGPDLPVARTNLRRRLVRLDPKQAFLPSMAHELERSLGPLPQSERNKPVHIVFAVGGAGAQAELAAKFLPSFAVPIRDGRVRITLVAGRRPEVAATFRAAISAAGLDEQLERGVQVLLRDDWLSYYRAFNALLADADVLWTKPSEMTFYAALGLPLILSEPVGVHEKYNKRWAVEAGAGLAQRDVSAAGEWLFELLEDGVLAGAAWAGFVRLPNLGLYRIVEQVRRARG